MKRGLFFLFVFSLLSLVSFSFVFADCPVINRTLKLGSQGHDVQQLQDFLESQGAYTEGNGIFGKKTQAAVEFWQNSVGIMPMGGVFDAESRSALAENCADLGDVTVKTEVVAVPSKGVAPLLTTLTVKAPSGDQFEYSVDLGDGSDLVRYVCKTGERCKDTYTLKHRFALPGVYKVQLFRGYGDSDLSVSKQKSSGKYVVSHTLVTVQDANPPVAPALCREWFDGCVVCTRAKKGEPLNCPKHTCFGAFEKPVCRSNVRVNKFPSVKVTGQATFVTDLLRPFSITAIDPEKTAMTYAFDWGDSGPVKAPKKYIKSNTQSHAYKNPGIYTITGFARDAEGGVGKGTFKVQVRDSYAEEICPKTYAPVCGVTTENIEKSYTNECMMRHDRAKKIRSGSC